jgi:hypothetical protein
MELSRRDALAALSAAGIAATAGCSSLLGDEGTETAAEETDEATATATDAPTDAPTETPADEASSMDTMVALAEVLYPSEVEPTESFVQTYLYGRVYAEEAYAGEVDSGIETLNGLANDEAGDDFHALSTDERVSVIENTDLRTGDSVHDGSDVERVNYHLVDELLFAFYSSPVGGEMVGTQNPRGFPGGYGYSPELNQ